MLQYMKINSFMQRRRLQDDLEYAYKVYGEHPEHIREKRTKIQLVI